MDHVDGLYCRTETKNREVGSLLGLLPCSLHTLAIRGTVELDRKKIQATYPVFSSDKICCRVEAKHQTKQPWK